MLLDTRNKLSTVNDKLAELVRLLAEEMDIVVCCGYRGKKEQDDAFNTGKSKLRWPKSAHNAYPSNAVDLAPANEQGSIDWNDKEAFKQMQARIREIAKSKNVELSPLITWDLPHLELKKG